jgi:hypothetical protein
LHLELKWLFTDECGVSTARRGLVEAGKGSRSPRIRGLLPLLKSRTSTMSEPTSCCRARGGYCERCDVLVGLDGLHVIGVDRDDGGGW